MERQNNLVIIDTDCGVDDALALILAIVCHKLGLIEILAITTVYGNTIVDNVILNVFQVLRVSQIQNIKVFKGSDRPLTATIGFEDQFFGNDGLGNSRHTMPEVNVVVESEHVVPALIRLTNKYPKRITYLALGPLTNLALAIDIEPHIADNFERIISMGGCVEGIGNVGPTTEFNYFNDPEAVHIVLTNIKCPIIIIPWETAIKHQMSWKRFDQLIASGKEKTDFIAKIYQNIADNKIFGRTRTKGIVFCDILVVITAVFPHLVLTSNEYPVAIELTGQLTRGQLVVDRSEEYPPMKRFNGSRKAHFVFKYDLPGSIDLFEKMILN